MSKRAEEAALKVYPKLSVASVCLDGTTHADLNNWARKRFIEGYEQAEKDLALTWEDASAIVEIAMDIIGEGKIHGEQNIYIEVLNRFNKGKEEKK